ncbi:sigma 54-interacting transcriptional regulator [Thiolapillus sp.]
MATNRNLKKMSENGEFRADLYYRLEAFTIAASHGERSEGW